MEPLLNVCAYDKKSFHALRPYMLFCLPRKIT